MTLADRDRRLIWHPFTQEQTAALPVPVKSASGSWLYDENDSPILDLISSWWVNLHGHAHPAIAKAIYEQACTLEHVIFAGFTHQGAVTLCEQLQKILPETLSRFFFSDNGSTAVETALKMAYQYWWNQGAPERTLFLAFEGGYHGDTFGAMSVGATSGFHDPFSKLFFPVQTIPFPETFQQDERVDEKENHALEKLEQCLNEHANKIAAMIVEPLVQGAAGMRMCRPAFIARLVSLLRSHGIPMIFDEVMTGFGRTGTDFALDQTGDIPDFLCLSKGLTGGFMPLALTVTTEAVYKAFLGEHFTRALAHGHSYTGNPLGCAAAIASLALLQQRETQAAQAAIQRAHAAGLSALAAACPDVSRVRLRGTIAAFDVSGRDPAELTSAFLKKGLLLRPLGNTVYLLPPYSTTEVELAEAYAKIEAVIFR